MCRGLLHKRCLIDEQIAINEAMQNWHVRMFAQWDLRPVAALQASKQTVGRGHNETGFVTCCEAVGLPSVAVNPSCELSWHAGNL